MRRGDKVNKKRQIAHRLSRNTTTRCLGSHLENESFVPAPATPRSTPPLPRNTEKNKGNRKVCIGSEKTSVFFSRRYIRIRTITSAVSECVAVELETPGARARARLRETNALTYRT